LDPNISNEARRNTFVVIKKELTELERFEKCVRYGKVKE
jgi:hypothetical protein